MSTDLAIRMTRAIKLDVSLYEEVERDVHASSQAIMVVAISRICTGLGSLVRTLFRRGFGLGIESQVVPALYSAVTGVALALVGWLIWSFLTYIVGTCLFRGPETEANFGELLRTIGFSSSPGIFNALSFFPFMTLLTGIWELAAMIVAVRQALDFETMKAVLTCSIGWIAYVIALTLIDVLADLPLPF
jgi:hypothetical protein